MGIFNLNQVKGNLKSQQTFFSTSCTFMMMWQIIFFSSLVAGTIGEKPNGDIISLIKNVQNRVRAMEEKFDTASVQFKGAIQTVQDKVDLMDVKLHGISSLTEKMNSMEKYLNALKRKCEGPAKCGKFGFCLGFEGSRVYCYGNRDSCLFGSNDCRTDADCAKYSYASRKFTSGDQLDCSGDKPLTGWRDDACKC